MRVITAVWCCGLFGLCTRGGTRDKRMVPHHMGKVHILSPIPQYFSAGFESHGVLVTTHTCICKFASTKCKGYKSNIQVINSMCHSTTSFHTLLYANLIQIANHSLAESLNKFLYLINKRLMLIFLIFYLVNLINRVQCSLAQNTR